MGANLQTVFVVDVESTCWSTDHGERQGGQPNEIIEIGVALLNIKTGWVVERASIVVKPRFSTVSPFCTELTGWTQPEIDKGLDIVDAFAEFTRLFAPTGNHVWFSCGEYDRLKLSSLTGAPGVGALYGILPKDNPFDQLRAHLNVKTLMALKHKLKREMGMAAALKFYGLELEGRHHNGADDAANIAKIVLKVLS
jgi:inhibitor of KinA sporulation pathway (predicted exonuclease)